MVGGVIAHMDASEEFTSRKQARIEEVEENDLVARTPLPKRNKNDSINVEEGIAINGH